MKKHRPWKNPVGARVRKSVYLDPVSNAKLDILKKQNQEISYGEMIDMGISLLYDKSKKEN